MNVVCADKTGTLTENGMRLSELRMVGDVPADRAGEVLAALAAHDPRPNASMIAVAEAYPTPPSWTVSAIKPASRSTG